MQAGLHGEVEGIGQATHRDTNPVQPERKRVRVNEARFVEKQRS